MISQKARESENLSLKAMKNKFVITIKKCKQRKWNSKISNIKW